MSTKLKNDFKKSLDFKSKEDKTEHDSKVLMFKFLSIIEIEMENRGMNKKELAVLLNTSPSYVTQLFRGTKTINLVKLAQLQELFEIEFDIKAKPKFLISKKSSRTIKTAKAQPFASVR